MSKLPQKVPVLGLFLAISQYPFPLLEQKALPSWRKNPNPPPAGPFSTPLLPPTTVPKYTNECT